MNIWIYFHISFLFIYYWNIFREESSYTYIHTYIYTLSFKFSLFVMSAISSKAVKRGCFILFEGVDRCGKTTQCQRLVEFLKKEGRSVEFMRFPERSTVIGKTINSYLTNGIDMNDEAIHLLFSANRWELSTQIKEKLAVGVPHGLDWSSKIAFQLC